MPIRLTRSVIPSLFTTANLFSGFYAIVKASEGDFTMAVWLIILGGIFDGLDGAMARLTRSSSEFGVELDSLADVVTFGAAPSFILWAAFFSRWDTIGVLIAALPAICGALRLARFNVQLVGYDKEYFLGLPIPSAALTVISYLVFFHLPADSFVAPSLKPALLTTITVIGALLMVSTVRYDTLPAFSPAGFRRDPLKFAVLIIAIALALVTRGASIFPSMAVYLLYGIGRQLFDLARRVETDGDTIEEDESTPFDL